MFHVRTRSLPREALLGRLSVALCGACGFAAGSQGYSKFYSQASIYGTDGCREGAWCARIVRLRSAHGRYESVQNQSLSLSQRAASEMGARHASKTAVALRKTDAWGCGASDCETLANYKSLALPKVGDS